MKKLHFKLFKRLSCIVVFTTLFFSHVQAKGINDAIQLPDFKSGKTIWVIRAGVGFNGFTGSSIETTKLQWENNDWNGSFGKATGYEFTLGFNKSFGNHPLYWGMELGMASRGYTSSSSWEKSGSSAISGGTDYHGKFQDESMLCHTVKFSPFTIGYRYTFLEKMTADIHLGAYASYDIAGKYKRDYTDHIISTSKYGNRNDKTTSSTETKIKDYDNMKRYDAGINLGIGYWFGKFNIDFTWQRGFIAIFEGGNELVKIGKESRKRGNLFTNNFQLKLGYAF